MRVDARAASLGIIHEIDTVRGDRHRPSVELGRHRKAGPRQAAKNYGHSDNRRHDGWSKDRGGQHRWNRGDRMGYNDWNNAQQVDYRQYHLRQPPRGYRWRKQGDQFILGAIAGGLIASIISGR